MSRALIPIHCPHCGAIFQSRAFAFSGNIQNLTLSGNRETCPFCRQMANVVDGVFNIAQDVVSVVAAPRHTQEVYAQLLAALRRGYEERTEPDDLAQEIERHDPDMAALIRASAGKPGFYLTVLLMLILLIKSCSVDVKLDANRLLDQITDARPAEVVQEAVDETDAK